MSKNPGKKFEEDFIGSVPDQIFYHRIRDMGGMYIRVKNLCDFILYKYPILYLLELKSSKGKSLPFSNIAEHQKDNLPKAGEREGIRSGFVINMRDLEETYFINADTIKNYIDTQTELFHKTDGAQGRKSIPIAWIREKGVRIPQQIRRTRYSYDITPLIKEED